MAGKRARGVCDDDTQWNALNFQYWISRDGENIVMRNPIFVDASADEQYDL